MDKLYELFKSSVIVQALIALGLAGTICYLFVVTGDAPEALINLFALILGFYFGSKAQQVITK